MKDSSAASTAFWCRPAVIVCAALVVRWIWCLCVPVDPISDGVLYDAFARSIATGHGYAFSDGAKTEYWPVGTSAVYALLYHLFGIRLPIVALFQSLLGALIVGLTWRIGRRMFGLVVAALAGWLAALWPLLVEFTTILASELLFVALLLLSINIWISRRMPFVTRTIAWATCIAAATYVRPTAWPLLVICPFLQWVFDRDLRALCKATVLAILTAALLFAPWAYRSVTLFGKAVLVSANGGVNLWMGNNPESTGGYMDLPDRKFKNEVDRDHFYGGEAVRFILSHPASYVRLAVRRTATTYSRETIGIVWNEKALSSKLGSSGVMILKGVSSVYWWIMFVLGLFGLTLLLRRGIIETVWPLLAAFGYFFLFPILTVGMDRYHIPVDPMLAILASYGLVTFRSDRRARPIPPEPAADT